jgi:hypothetical protein
MILPQSVDDHLWVALRIYRPRRTYGSPWRSAHTLPTRLSRLLALSGRCPHQCLLASEVQQALPDKTNDYWHKTNDYWKASPL